MGEIIAILSGKGGTGKTSVCAGIATALAASKKRVLCIDCDIGLRNLDISLGMSESHALSFWDICEGKYPLSMATENPFYSGLFLLTAPVGCSVETISETSFNQMLSDARTQFDYILLDSPAGIDKGFQLTAKFADRILLVTAADPASMRDAEQAGQSLERMGKTDVRLIVNRINKKVIGELSLTIDDIMDSVGLPLIGVVPEDVNVVLSATFSRPLLIYKPGKKGATAAFKNIANRLEGIPTPLSLR